MNKISKIILMILIVLLLGFFLSIIMLNVIIINTVGSETFYLEVLNKSDFNVEMEITNSLPAELPLNEKLLFANSVKNLVLQSLTYAFGTTNDINVEINMPGTSLGMPDSSEQINAQITEVKKQLKPAHDGFSILRLLLIPSIVLILLLMWLFYFISKDLRSTINWIGNIIAWPTLIVIIPLLFAKSLITAEQLNLGNPLYSKIAFVAIQTLTSKLLLIFSILFVVGLIIWISHFFIKKDTKTQA